MAPARLAATALFTASVLVYPPACLPASLTAQAPADTGREPADIAALEARVAADRSDGEAHFALARALIEGLPADRTVVMERMPTREQVRVTRLFEDALRLDPQNPRYLIGYAEWLVTLGREGEAGQVAERAVRGLEEQASRAGPDAEPDAILGDARDSLLLAGYRAQARALSGQVEDNRYWVQASDLPVSSPECPEELFCQAYVRPEMFNSLLREAQEASSLPQGSREELVELLERVFARDPADADALRALASERFAAGEWEAAARAARAHLEVMPGSAWGQLVLGTAQWRSGDARRAATALTAGFAALPEATRRAWWNPDKVLPSDAADRLARLQGTERAADVGEAYWSRSDPLLLTVQNERWLEHIAREVYVELRFGVPERGLAGRDTHRGDVFLRLGHPLRIIQVDRDASKELDAEETRAAVEIINCGAGGACQQQAMGRAGLSRHGGGRWTFWVYVEQEAPFIFEAPMRGREPRHKVETRSRDLAEHVARDHGSVFEPVGVTDLVVQVARFRGGAAGVTELVLAPERPWTLEGAPVRRSGLFVVDLRSGRRLVERVADGAPQPLYALQLPAGASVRTRLEVLAEAEGEAPDPAAGEREGGAGDADTLAAPGPRDRVLASTWEAVEDVAPWEEGLGLSDLLLARRVAAPGDTPASWRELDIDPLSALRLAPGDSLGVVFEVYGLDVDQGLSSYDVRVELAEPEGRSFAARAVRLLGRALGLADEPEATMLEWTRQAEPTDGRVIDYFVLVADELAGDSVELRVEIRDRLSGTAVSATRTLTVEPLD